MEGRAARPALPLVGEVRGDDRAEQGAEGVERVAGLAAVAGLQRDAATLQDVGHQAHHVGHRGALHRGGVDSGAGDESLVGEQLAQDLVPQRLVVLRRARQAVVVERLGGAHGRKIERLDVQVHDAGERHLLPQRTCRPPTFAVRQVVEQALELALLDALAQAHDADAGPVERAASLRAGTDSSRSSCVTSASRDTATASSPVGASSVVSSRCGLAIASLRDGCPGW